MHHKNNFLSNEVNLESFFLLIKLNNDIYSNNKQKYLLFEQIKQLINSGLQNLEISWSNNTNWLDLVSNIKIKYPDINLGSASIVNKQSIEDSMKIGLKFSMMKFWDKDLFNFAKKNRHLLIPGINNLNDLEEAINLNCKIIKIYPIQTKDDLIDIKNYCNIDFIAAGGLSINDLKHYKSLGYKTIIIGDKGIKNQKFDPDIFKWLKNN